MTLDLEELERLEREATKERAQGRSTGQAAVRWYQAGTAVLPALLAELRALRVVAEAAEAHVDNSGRDDTYAAIAAAVKAWRGLQ